ncbi:hypothetical protein G3T14_13085 [Methylobacterium sp. BTF04]|uniref:hypothetical protein n=1 Tax=Methylobacterium sp. BTF04 TaxID=2708300 RepID=UPI0013D235F9|nr:hypothetical protein [Methylobacterium sp. BTF04]NEU13067.1 hypothetical protein [Methylobacterium sp. BTF04]
MLVGNREMMVVASSRKGDVMRNSLWTHPGFLGFGCNPILTGIARALTDLYEPLMRETLPERWNVLVARFDART